VYETVTSEMVMDRLVSLCDVIVHLAASVGVELIVKDPVQTIETNLEGTEVVLKLARRYRKKVILASSSEVYGKSHAVPFHEDADRVMGPTTRSRWSYAESKAIDEFLALAYHKQFGVPTVICRFFNTVGPRQTGSYGMVIPRLVEQALTGKPLTVYGDGQQTRCFCNVKDTVRAVLALAAEPKAVGEIFNVGSQEEITIRALAERIRARAQSQSPIVLVPYDEAYAKGFEDMYRRVPSLDKIKAAIGWQPTLSLDHTLDEIIAHFRASA
jgi:UDP-glucose 4-epimerase